MFLTTHCHSVFEQLLFRTTTTSESADRGGRTAERNTVPGSARRGAGVAGRAHKELTDTRVRCARVCAVRARVLGVVRAARRAAASAVVPSADVAAGTCTLPCRRR